MVSLRSGQRRLGTPGSSVRAHTQHFAEGQQRAPVGTHQLRDFDRIARGHECLDPMLRMPGDMPAQVALHRTVHPGAGFIAPVAALWRHGGAASFRLRQAPLRLACVPVMNGVSEALWCWSEHARRALEAQFIAPLHQGTEPSLPVRSLRCLARPARPHDLGQGLQPLHQGFKGDGVRGRQQRLAAGVAREEGEFAAGAMARVGQRSADEAT